jgi:hypothetical protein
MPGSWKSDEFPRLATGNHVITSPATRRYNCIAWVAGEVTRKWWPDPRNIGWWPAGVKRAETIEAFVEAYGTLGFRLCYDGSLQPGVEKVAIFGIRPSENELPIPTHAALQLESGEWSSKLGDFEDISHSPVDAVAGPLYGTVICFLERQRTSDTPRVLRARASTTF